MNAHARPAIQGDANVVKNLGIKREDVVIVSKVYFNEGCLSKEAIHQEIEGTLKRLGTDYLDLYQIHRFELPILYEMILG